VGHRSKLAALVPGTVCLVAVAAMTAAATLFPFIGRPCLVCFNSGGQPPYEATMSLLNGDDGQLVLVALFSLGVAAICHLTGRIPTVSAIACVALSLTTLILCVFELNANRLEPWLTAVGPNGSVSPAPSTLEAGFFLFLGGAAMSIVASLLMVPEIFRGSSARAETSLNSLPS
jgi:hypothetical protein